MRRNDIEMRLRKLLSRWRRESPQPAPQPPRPVPIKLQTAMQDFERKLADLQTEYVGLRESAIENHARDRARVDRLDQCLDQTGKALEQFQASNREMEQRLADLLKYFLGAIAEISATANQIVAQHSAAAAPPCDSQNLPNEPLPARSPDSGSSCLSASDSKTCQDAAASGLSAAPDSDPPV